MSYLEDDLILGELQELTVDDIQDKDLIPEQTSFTRHYKHVVVITSLASGTNIGTTPLYDMAKRSGTVDNKKRKEQGIDWF